MTNYLYTEDHEWVSVDKENGTVTIGITDFAQQQLGDIVFVELPEVGQNFAKGDTGGNLESVKAVSEFYVPCSGEVIEVNGALTDSPETINEDPQGEAWLIKMKYSDASEFDTLLNSDAYAKLLEQEH